jgi:hypothetical protein
VHLVCAAVGVVVLTGAAACGAAPAVVPVPSFPAVAAPTTSPPAGSDPGRGLPADCEQLLGHDELPELLGLPVGSITVRIVLGVPAPAVGRLQRMDCTYTVTDPNAPPLGVVLQMSVGLYRDAAAARDQHDRNVADEQVGASSSRQPHLGAATATVVQRGAEYVLLTTYGRLTVDFDLAPRAEPLPPEDLLTDLARRVLSRLTSSRPDDVPGPAGPPGGAATGSYAARGAPAS